MIIAAAIASGINYYKNHKKVNQPDKVSLMIEQLDISIDNDPFLKASS